MIRLHHVALRGSERGQSTRFLRGYSDAINEYLCESERQIELKSPSLKFLDADLQGDPTNKPRLFEDHKHFVEPHITLSLSQRALMTPLRGSPGKTG